VTVSRHPARDADRRRPPRRFRGLARADVRGHRVPVASTFRSRLLGLAMLDCDAAGAGLLIPECNRVHTFGMSFGLDLVFLDGRGTVVATCHSVPPRRLRHEPRARAVLELPAGRAGETEPPLSPSAPGSSATAESARGTCSSFGGASGMSADHCTDARAWQTSRGGVVAVRLRIAMLVGATVAIAFLALIVAPRADAFVYWTNGSPTSSGLSIGRANLDGSGANQNFIQFTFAPTGGDPLTLRKSLTLRKR
jgi:uncharacterized membrane protein (UPF0127 family)